MVWSSGQNIDRLVTVFKACRAAKRQLIIDMYTAEILRATGNDNLPQGNWDGVRVFLPKSQRGQTQKRNLYKILKKYKSHRIYPENLSKEAGSSVMLIRPSMCEELEEAKCLSGSSFIHSLWGGYLNMDRQKPFLKWLDQHKIPLIRIHTSGHASITDLKRLAEAVDARKLVPIHSYNPDRFQEYFSGVETKTDGVWWEVE
jgi:ribonuclease J